MNINGLVETQIVENIEQILIKTENGSPLPIEFDVLNLEEDRRYLNSILGVDPENGEANIYVEDFKLSSPCSIVCRKLIVVEGKDAYLDTSPFEGCKRTSLNDITEVRLCFLCLICHGCFVDEVDFNIHLNIHNNNNTIKRQPILWDEKYHSKATPFKCGICGKYLCSKADLGKHIRRRHEGEQNYGCSYCGRRFSDSTNCNVHLMIHTGERPFECKICKKTFKRSHHLQCHMYTHTGEKNYTCVYCDKKFSRDWSLRTHIRIHTLEKPFGCLVCFKKFTTRSDLTKHEVYHTKEKKFKCDQCNRRFYQRNGLKEHLNTHTGATLECSFCLKKLANKLSLKKHVSKYHGGVKPFQCTKCYKYYSDLIMFKLHLNQHNIKLKHKCELCGRGFNDRGSLFKHIKVHTRPFACEMCSKTFSRLMHLKKHLYRHLDGHL